MTTSPAIAHISANWQDQLRDVITDGAQLLALLELTPSQAGFSPQASADFALKVPHSFVRRMRKGDPADPLLLQVLSQPRELLEAPGYNTDPVGETDTSIPVPGLIHKYRGRVLLIVASGCMINCRYCFRRHFPYQDNRNSREQWQAALDYIRADNSIEEVIFSGGDPLVATDAYLAELVNEVGAIDHIKRLRVHSRVPIVLPDRITESLMRALTHDQLQTVMVLHCNHANEIDGQVSRAVQKLREHDVSVLNQAVLLADVNNSAQAQTELCEALFAIGVMPYYLHLLDKVQGAAHFDVDEATALALHREMQARLPGYMVPKLVRELAGAAAKTSVVSPS